MRKDKHRRGVERTLREAIRRDRARTKILRTSPFGLIEMTRQRIRPSLKRSVFVECPYCKGSGLLKSAESMAIDVLRKLMLGTQQTEIATMTVTVADTVSAYLNNRKRRELSRLEDDARTAGSRSSAAKGSTRNSSRSQPETKADGPSAFLPAETASTLPSSLEPESGGFPEGSSRRYITGLTASWWRFDAAHTSTRRCR